MTDPDDTFDEARAGAHLGTLLRERTDHIRPDVARRASDAIRVGTRIRRRRTVAIGLGAVTSVALVVAAGSAIGPLFPPAVETPGVAAGGGGDVSALPMSTGTGATLSSVIAAAGGTDSAVWGGLHTLRAEPAEDGNNLVAYVTGSGSLCIGSSDDSGQEPPSPSVCKPIENLPQAGLAAGMSYAPNSTPTRPATVIALGLVVGKASRIEVSGASGVEDAHLIWLPGKEAVGLYWIDTGIVAADLDQAGLDVGTIRRTVYRDQRAVFSCSDRDRHCT